MGEYVVAFLLRILIIYLMRIFCFYANPKRDTVLREPRQPSGVVAFLLRIHIIYLMGIFWFIVVLEISAVKYRLYLGSRKYELGFVFLLIESDGRQKKIFMFLQKDAASIPNADKLQDLFQSSV